MRGWRRLALFAAGALPGPVLVAWINDSLYGSPMRSGYGDLGGLFSFANVGPNLVRYPGWLWQTHTVLVFAGVIAAPVLLISLRGRLSAAARRTAWYSLAFSVLLFGAYLAYRPFGDWTYLRFLLPSIALLTLLGAWSLSMLLAPAHAALRVVAVVVLTLAAADSGFEVQRLGVMDIRGTERRYVEVAEYIRTNLAPRRIVIAQQYTGSIWYYAGRTTLRWDYLDREWFDRAIERLQRMDRSPVLVLEEWEEPAVRERFKGQRWAALDWPPRVQFDTSPVVRLYDPSDREAYRQGQMIRTLHTR